MLHLRRDVVPSVDIDTGFADQRHAALALARGIGICLVAVSALIVFCVGALALGTVVFID